MMKNIKLFENFGFRKIMTIKKFNEELSFSLIKCDYKVRTVDNYMTSAKSKVYQFTVHDNVYDVYFSN
jgi:predicted nucleotidyltransferase